MTCTFFGHSDTPEEIKTALRQVLIDLIENKNVNRFYVGNHGHFDYFAKEILKDLKEIYPITYYVVLAYMPQKDEYNDYTDTIYPDEISTVPYKLRIIARNKWMLKKSDIIITYVARIIGGAAEFKALAEKQNKIIVNLINPLFI